MVTSSDSVSYYDVEMEEAEESLVRLRLITNNARLVDARRELGITQPTAAQALGISRVRLQELENLKRKPTEDEICKLASFLRKAPEYLFPDELLSAIDAGVFSRRKVELNQPQIISLTQAKESLLLSDAGGIDEVEEKVDNELLTQKLFSIGSLNQREQLIIELRFGFKDGRCRTLEEVGNELNVTRERIRQVESTALRKLRHPSRSRFLESFFSPPEPERKWFHLKTKTPIHIMPAGDGMTSIEGAVTCPICLKAIRQRAKSTKRKTNTDNKGGVNAG